MQCRCRRPASAHVMNYGPMNYGPMNDGLKNDGLKNDGPMNDGLFLHITPKTPPLKNNILSYFYLVFDSIAP